MWPTASFMKAVKSTKCHFIHEISCWEANRKRARSSAPTSRKNMLALSNKNFVENTTPGIYLVLRVAPDFGHRPKCGHRLRNATAGHRDATNHWSAAGRAQRTKMPWEGLNHFDILPFAAIISCVCAPQDCDQILINPVAVKLSDPSCHIKTDGRE